MLSQLVKLMRPHQWTKNLVLFAGLIFSRHALDIPLLGRAAAAFVLFCLLSASVYATNDVADARKDRLHPAKRTRPVASGRISPALALTMGSIWGAVGVAGSFLLGESFGLVAVLYLLLNLAYSFRLKNMVVLDVLSISVGFVLRAIGGVEALAGIAPGIILSPWLLVCTLFLALFLALGKRRQEIANVDGASDHRRSLGEYSTTLLDLMIGSVAAVLVLAYSLYTIWPATVQKFHTEHLLYTVPFVVYGIFRYLYLVYQRDQGGNPAEILLRDLPLGMAIIGWLAAVAWILY